MRLLLFSFLFITIFSSCDDSDKFSSQNKILQIVVKEDQNASVTIDTIAFTVTIGVNKAVPVNALTLNFAISPKAKISPASGVTQDFTTPKTYTVTAENGKAQVYTISATNLSDEKKIYRASIPALFQDGTGVISTNAITFILPYGTNLTNISIVATLSEGATASPAFSAPHDYSSPVIHTITAANGSKTKLHGYHATCTTGNRNQSSLGY